MNANTMMPKEYLSGKDVHDVKGKALSFNATIADIKAVTIGDDDAWALLFAGTERKLKLNKTNLSTLIEMFGPETDDWLGKQVGLVGAMTEFQGKRVQAIRINVPEDNAKPLATKFDPEELPV